MEKPVIGQKWKTPMGGTFTLTEYTDDTHWKVHWYDGIAVTASQAPEIGSSFAAYIRNDTLAGGPQPSEAPREDAIDAATYALQGIDYGVPADRVAPMTPPIPCVSCGGMEHLPTCATDSVKGRAPEQWDGATHMPLTALQAIQARVKPEPWRPSVDEDHWIPDA